MLFFFASMAFMYIGRVIGWSLSRPLYLAPLGIVAIFGVAWGAIVAGSICALIACCSPGWFLRWVFGYFLGGYVAIPNFGLVNEASVPDRQIRQHVLLKSIPWVTYIVLSIVFANTSGGFRRDTERHEANRTAVPTQRDSTADSNTPVQTKENQNTQPLMDAPVIDASPWLKDPVSSVPKAPPWEGAPVIPDEEFQKMANEYAALQEAREDLASSQLPQIHAIAEQIRSPILSMLNRLDPTPQIDPQVNVADEYNRRAAAFRKAIAETDTPERLLPPAIRRGLREVAVWTPGVIVAGLFVVILMRFFRKRNIPVQMDQAV